MEYELPTVELKRYVVDATEQHTGSYSILAKDAEEAVATFIEYRRDQSMVTPIGDEYGSTESFRVYLSDDRFRERCLAEVDTNDLAVQALEQLLDDE